MVEARQSAEEFALGALAAAGSAEEECRLEGCVRQRVVPEADS